MTTSPAEMNRRILVVDDNAAIHEDFMKILSRDLKGDVELADVEKELFGDAPAPSPKQVFEVDSAYQGEDGLVMVRRALDEGRPYSVVFVDVRMPPGVDGIETASRLWELDRNIQTVICTAYSDYSWEQILGKLGHSDRLVILKKPFDTIEVLQLADALTRKWQRTHDANRHLSALQQLIRGRSKQLCAAGSDSANIDEAQLALAAQVVTTQVQEQLVLEDELRKALEAGQLSAHYQPIVDVATREIVGLEALARWQHPTAGWISPAAFVPVAEESGLILALGERVLRLACEQLALWIRQGLRAPPVAVNISAVQLRRQNLLEVVRGVMRDTGVPPHLLVLELTESALLENMQKHVDALDGLRREGVTIAIDDFGTGYSSLSYLQRLPVDTIKIDRSFVQRIDTNPVDAAIVSAIVAMAHSLQMRVVAEGVETSSQLEALARHGCEMAQGFFFARPTTAADFATMLDRIEQPRAVAGLRG